MAAAWVVPVMIRGFVDLLSGLAKSTPKLIGPIREYCGKGVACYPLFTWPLARAGAASGQRRGKGGWYTEQD